MSSSIITVKVFALILHATPVTNIETHISSIYISTHKTVAACLKAEAEMEVVVNHSKVLRYKTVCTPVDVEVAVPSKTML